MNVPIENSRRWDWPAVVERLGPMLALIVLVAVTAVLERLLKHESHFLKAENIFNILRQYSFVGIVAVGMTFVIISGGIDLSVGSLLACAGGIGIWMMNTAILATKLINDNALARKEYAENVAAGLNLPLELPWSAFRESLAHWSITLHLGTSEPAGVVLAVLAALVVATFAGWLNGLLITRGRVAPFIVTLGGLAAFRSIAMAIADGGEFRSASHDLFGSFGAGGISIPGQYVAEGVPLQFPNPTIVFLVIALAAAVLLRSTRYGRYVCAIGSNERAAVYSAINVNRIKSLTYTLMGFLAGIAGIMVASRTTAVTSSATGNLYELDAIAAVVIGGTRMQGGSGGIAGTVIGVLILGVIGSMLNFLDVSTYLQGLVKGVIIVVAVLLQRLGQKR